MRAHSIFHVRCSSRADLSRRQSLCCQPFHGLFYLPLPLPQPSVPPLFFSFLLSSFPPTHPPSLRRFNRVRDAFGRRADRVARLVPRDAPKRHRIPPARALRRARARARPRRAHPSSTNPQAHPGRHVNQMADSMRPERKSVSNSHTTTALCRLCYNSPSFLVRLPCGGVWPGGMTGYVVRNELHDDGCSDQS